MNPYIQHIKEETKKEILDQVEHLKDLSERHNCIEHNDNTYLHMLSGANTVLNILLNDSFSNEGANNWLKQMDYSQLCYVRKVADQLIKEKDNEERVLLWCVSSEDSIPYFTKDYKEAAQKSIDLMEQEVNNNLDDEENITVKLEKRYVRESEVKDYLS